MQDLRWAALTGLVPLLALMVPQRVHAQDPVSLYPGNYSVLYENERVRVLDFRLAKGASEQTHTHPANVAVFLQPVKIRFTLPDGETRIRAARAGEVAYSEATAHASENIGEADAHGILVELKAAAPKRSGVTGPERARTNPAPASGRPVTAFTLIHGVPGHEAELKEHLRSLAGPTRAEAGCLAYDLYQSPDRPYEFLRFEMWASQEALDAHKRSPHLRASFEKRQREGWTTDIVLWEPVP